MGLDCKLIGKDGKDLKNPINYRPITLLELTGKVFERILNNRLMRFFEERNLLGRHQYGFRRGRGTDVALATVYETIALNQRRKQQCTVVARDVSKAFDKVWHDGLKYKLLQIGLPDVAEKIFCNYLDGRQARIKINEYIGPPFRLLSGVPQGSVLSPSYYIFHTSDSPPPINQTTVNVAFADDITQITQVMAGGRNRSLIARRTSAEVENINRYEGKWKIKTNAQKFQMMMPSYIKKEDVRVGGQVIPYTQTVKVLGLTLSRTGIQHQFRSRIRMARAAGTKLNRFKQLSTKTKIHLLKALVFSVLEYPAVPLCTASQTNLIKMQRVINNNLRRMASTDPDNRELTIKQLHLKYNLEPLNIRLYNRAQKVWDKLRTLNPELVEESLQREQVWHNRDHHWWKTIGNYITQDPPAPVYVLSDVTRNQDDHSDSGEEEDNNQED